MRGGRLLPRPPQPGQRQAEQGRLCQEGRPVKAARTERTFVGNDRAEIAEHAALAVDVNEANSEIFTTRLQSLIDIQNNQENRSYRLSISVGCSYYDPENPRSIDALMASADKVMYEQKQNKKGLLLQGSSPGEKY